MADYSSKLELLDLTLTSLASANTNLVTVDNDGKLQLASVQTTIPSALYIKTRTINTWAPAPAIATTDLSIHLVNTSGSNQTITLPAASSSMAGRLLFFTLNATSTKNVVLQADASDYLQGSLGATFTLAYSLTGARVLIVYVAEHQIYYLYL